MDGTLDPALLLHECREDPDIKAYLDLLDLPFEEVRAVPGSSVGVVRAFPFALV